MVRFKDLGEGDRFRALVKGSFEFFPIMTKRGCYGRTDDGYKYRIDPDREVRPA